jgi:hypothetical protein
MPVRSRSRASSSTQKCAAVVVERAQFVEIGVEAVGDDAAVADQGAGSGRMARFSRSRRRPGWPVAHAVRRAVVPPPRRRQRRAQFGQALQAVAQARQVARAGAVERDAPGDTFDVGKAAHGLAQRTQRAATVVEQHGNRRVAGGRDRRVAQGMVQGVPQQPRAHGGDAVVEQAAQRRRRLAAQGFGEFEVAPRRHVEPEEGGVAFDDQRPQVRQGARLGRLGVAQQCAGSGDRRPQPVGTEAGQRSGARSAHAVRGPPLRRRNASPADGSAPLPG